MLTDAAMVLSLAACGNTNNQESTESKESVENDTKDATADDSADDAEVGSAEQAADGSDRENHAIVSMQNRKLVCKSFQNVKKGQKMLLKFRPEECIFVEKECKNAIPVCVVMSSFEGGQYRVKVETDGGDTFCLLHPTFLKEQQMGYAQILPERLYAYEEISG